MIVSFCVSFNLSHKEVDKNQAIEYGSKIKTGTEQNRWFIFLTSMAMIMLLNVVNLPHHIDCTYKLCERGFPLLVFGLSDICGHFYPIAFAIISHEQEFDFYTFFVTLLEFCKLLAISPLITHLVQDACGVCANAASAWFGTNLTILMCFFHVQKNIKEHLKNVDEKL